MDADVYECPDYFRPGAGFRITLDDSAGNLQLVVTRPILPFTSSQVVVARLASKDAGTKCSLPLGSSVVVKTFDPRFLKRRGPDEDDQPWSYAAELVGFARHHTQLKHVCQQPQPDARSPADWEEFYFQRMAADHAAEVAAYRALRPLQGQGVPVFFGSGTLDLAHCIAPPRAFSPGLILIEHIADAANLRDIDPRLLRAPLVAALLETVRALGPLGVVHGDLNFTNFLFAPAGRPARAVLIDFADALCRAPGCSDAEWARTVAQYRNVHETRARIAMRFRIADLRVPEGCRVEDIPGLEDGATDRTPTLPPSELPKAKR